MKKFIFLIALMIFILTGCGQNINICFGTDDQGDPNVWMAVKSLEPECIYLFLNDYIKENGTAVTMAFDDSSNDYASSQVRSYLNDVFFQNSFKDYEKGIMLEKREISIDFDFADKASLMFVPPDIAAYNVIRENRTHSNNFWIYWPGGTDPVNAMISRDGAPTYCAISELHTIVPVIYLDTDEIMFAVSPLEAWDKYLGVLSPKYIDTGDNDSIYAKLIILQDDPSVPNFTYPQSTISIYEGSKLVLTGVEKISDDSFIRCVYKYPSGIEYLLGSQYGTMEYDEAEKTATMDISDFTAGSYSFSFWYENDLGTDDNTNICGQKYDLTVVIMKEKPEILLADASDISSNSAKVSMSITNRDESEATETGIEVSPNSNFSPGSTGGMMFSLSGDDLTYNAAPLLKNTLYYYRAYAVDVNGKYYSKTKTFTTYNDKYTITASSGSGGTISPTSTTVSLGQNKTFSITPNSGYKVSAVYVDGASVGAIGSYTFSNVSSNHTISASFAEIAVETYTASTGTKPTPSPSDNSSSASHSISVSKTTPAASESPAPTISVAPSTSPDGSPATGNFTGTSTHLPQVSVESLTNNGDSVFLGIHAGDAESIEIGGLTFEVIDGIAQAEIPYGWVENGSLDITLMYSDGTSLKRTIAVPYKTSDGIPNWILVVVAVVAIIVIVIMLWYWRVLNKKVRYVKRKS